MSLSQDLNQPWESYWSGGPPTGEQRNRLIRSFLPLVRAIGRKLKAGLPAHVPYDDLVSAGVIGLISAVDRFDPEKGHNFRRYAAIRIRGTMLDELRLMDWAPRSIRRDASELDRTRRRLEAKLGRRATSEELAEGLGIDAEKYGRLVRRLVPKNIIHLEDLGIRSDSDRQSALNFLRDPSSPDPVEESALKDAYETLVRAIDQLKERQRQMISLYYFDNLNLKEIAAIFGVTEGRVSQVHSEALRALKKKLRDRIG